MIDRDPPWRLSRATSVHELVQPGQVVVLDASAEVAALVPQLVTIPGLTIITTGIDLALTASDATEHMVVLVGGEVDSQTRSVVFEEKSGQILEPAIGFFGAVGHTPQRGLMEREPRMAASVGGLSRLCRTRYGILRPSRLGAFGPYTSVPSEALDRVFLLDSSSDLFEMLCPYQVSGIA